MTDNDTAGFVVGLIVGTLIGLFVGCGIERTTGVFSFHEAQQRGYAKYSEDSMYRCPEMIKIRKHFLDFAVKDG